MAAASARRGGSATADATGRHCSRSIWTPSSRRSAGPGTNGFDTAMVRIRPRGPSTAAPSTERSCSSLVADLRSEGDPVHLEVDGGLRQRRGSSASKPDGAGPRHTAIETRQRHLRAAGRPRERLTADELGRIDTRHVSRQIAIHLQRQRRLHRIRQREQTAAASAASAATQIARRVTPIIMEQPNGQTAAWNSWSATATSSTACSVRPGCSGRERISAATRSATGHCGRASPTRAPADAESAPDSGSASRRPALAGAPAAPRDRG